MTVVPMLMSVHEDSYATKIAKLSLLCMVAAVWPPHSQRPPPAHQARPYGILTCNFEAQHQDDHRTNLLQDMPPLELVASVRDAHSVAHFALEPPHPAALAMLSRIESVAYTDARVHPATRRQADATAPLHNAGSTRIVCPGLTFRLPRLRLEFEVRDGGLHSLDFGGYRVPSKADLRASALRDALTCIPPFLQSFLLLLPDSEATRVRLLIPDGAIAYDGAAGRVVISPVGATSASELRYHAYSVHPHTHHLHAQTKDARLFLAALYAAGGCAAPVPRLGHTGGQMAVRLLRQCAGNAPLSADELRNLRSVADASSHTPALRVLASSLASHASACDFLWPRAPATAAHMHWRAGAEAYMLSHAQNAPAGLPLPCGHARERLTPYEAAVCLGQGSYFQHGTQRQLAADLPVRPDACLEGSAARLAALQARLRGIADVASGARARPPSAASSSGSAPCGPRTPEPGELAPAANSDSVWFQYGNVAAAAAAPAASHGSAAASSPAPSTPQPAAAVSPAAAAANDAGLDSCLAQMRSLSLDGSQPGEARSGDVVAAKAKRRRLASDTASGAGTGAAPAPALAEVAVPFQTDAMVQHRVGIDLISDLKASMLAYLNSAESHAAATPARTALDAAAQMLSELQRSVQLERDRLQRHILSALEAVPRSGDGMAYSALQAVGLAASAAQADLVELAYKPHILQVQRLRFRTCDCHHTCLLLGNPLQLQGWRCRALLGCYMRSRSERDNVRVHVYGAGFEPLLQRRSCAAADELCPRLAGAVRAARQGLALPQVLPEPRSAPVRCAHGRLDRAPAHGAAQPAHLGPHRAPRAKLARPGGV